MIATNEELALLEKWKRKLCLQEWRIKLLTHLHPEEMMVRNTTGCTEMNRDVVIYATPTITKDISYNTRDLVIDLGNSVPHPDRFNCPYVNRIGQLTVSVLLNRFARKEHRA